MPYGLTIHPDGTIQAFNREYQPLGINSTQFNVEDFSPEELPLGLKPKKPETLGFWKKVAHKGEVREMGEGVLRLWFYDDSTNPSATERKADWSAYFERIQMVQHIQRESE